MNKIDKGRPGEKSILRHIYAVTGGAINMDFVAGGQSTGGSHLCDIAFFDRKRRTYLSRK